MIQLQRYPHRRRRSQQRYQRRQ